MQQILQLRHPDSVEEISPWAIPLADQDGESCPLMAEIHWGLLEDLEEVVSRVLAS